MCIRDRLEAGSDKDKSVITGAELDKLSDDYFNKHVQDYSVYACLLYTSLAVLTSYSESFPLVLLEASDNLVPIMSTDVGDIEKMIPSEKYGFVAKIGNFNDISEKLKQAISTSQEKLEEMAEKEKTYLMHAFSMKNQLVAIENYYKFILGEK